MSARAAPTKRNKTNHTFIVVKRFVVVLVLASPILWLGVGFLIFPSAAAQHLLPDIEPLASVLTGIVFETTWQFAVLFGWFALLCLYLYFVDISFQRTSLAVALATVLCSVSFAAILLHQQKRIAVTTALNYID